MLALRTAPSVRSLAPLARAYASYNGGYSDNRSFDRGRPRRFDNSTGGGQPRFNRGGERGDRNNNRDDKAAERLRYNAQSAEARATTPPPHLLTLADLNVEEISQLVRNALAFKLVHKKFGPQAVHHTLNDRTVGMIFSKRSTRTRVATETSVSALGGHPCFFGKDDIQLGVNETLEDSSRVISSMVDGIMARVAKHEEVATLAKYSAVPVVNALCDLYHPTQILADLLTMVETYSPPIEIETDQFASSATKVNRAVRNWIDDTVDVEGLIRGKKMAWVGDQNNITNELMVTLPRFGVEMAVAAPKGYDTVDPRVLARLEEHGTASSIKYTNSPAEALKNADLVVTDTWISMGQEEETAKRLAAFAGYQITNEMVESAGAKADWKFMHCLPRHKEEVDDAVFYGERSLVFPEAENRKWTIMAVFDALVGRWARA